MLILCFFFLLFISKATQIRKRKIAELEETLNENNSKKEEMENEAKRAKLSRKDDGEREELIAELAKLKTRKDELLELIEEYRDSDPDVVAQEKKDIKVIFYFLLFFIREFDNNS